MVVMVVKEEDVVSKRWGTWEELILGGAVIRHGNQNWDAVALELQARTLFPFYFTPQVCKAKYEELMDHYSGCSAWFEELRKRRVQELRRALEKSEDSIGSLVSKLESLKADKAACNNTVYSSSQAGSRGSEGNESSGKEASKDGFSAGSFTQQTRKRRSPRCHVATEASVGEVERKPVEWDPSSRERFPSICKLAETILLERGVSIRRRRGKRGRRDSTKIGKEVFYLSDSTNVVTPSYARSADANNRDPCTSMQGIGELMEIFDSIVENEHFSIFKRRVDSQKRGRYKKMTHEHIDLDTIKLKIANRSITSPLGLLRELLLLTKNALAFYSKTTREHKGAMILRDLVIQRLRQQTTAAVGLPKSPTRQPPVKPGSGWPFNGDLVDKAKNGLMVESSYALARSSPGQRGKVGAIGCENGGIQAEVPIRVKKRGKRVN